MSLSIYVASSFRNARQSEVVRRLREDGHKVYDFREATGFHWRDIDPNWESWTPAQMRDALEHELAKAAFNSDQDALDWCDAVVYVLPCGKSASLELGYAVGAGKLTAVLLDDSGDPETMFKLAHVICLTVEDVVDWLNAGPE